MNELQTIREVLEEFAEDGNNRSSRRPIHSIALDMACIRLANAMNSKAVAVKAIEHKGTTLLVKTTQYKTYKD